MTRTDSPQARRRPTGAAGAISFRRAGSVRGAWASPAWRRSARLRRHTDHPASRRAAPTRRGAVLVLVVFFIFLAGALSVLITANSVQLVRTTRSDHESVLLRQMSDSAHAWLMTRADWRADLPVVLDMRSILPDTVSGDARMQADDERPGVVVITARLMLGERRLSRTIRFTAPS